MVRDRGRVGRPHSIGDARLAEWLTAQLLDAQPIAWIAPDRQAVPSAPGLIVSTPAIVLDLALTSRAKERRAEGRRFERHRYTTQTKGPDA
jgi:hypothetical protein